MTRALIAFVLLSQPLYAQVPSELAQERAQFAEWLATAPNSPLVARGVAPIGPGIRIGPADAEVAFPGVDLRITEGGGSVTLEGAPGRRVLPRGRATTAGPATLFVSGEPGHSVVTVYGGPRAEKRPIYFPHDPTKVYTGPLHRASPRTVRILALDGIQVDASEVGSVVVPDGAGSVRLRVYRIPDASSEESELMINFRDGTNGKGTYPAGRFVPLNPLPDGRYRLDFNRAQNPFCAYSSAYPCPAPWPGNTLTTPLEAGERYDGGGLAIPTVTAP